MEQQTMEYGDTTRLNTSTFTKDGYSFAFWNTKADGSGTVYQDEQEVLLVASGTNQITLYAIYEQFSYEHVGEYVFDGTNYDNTSIYLFSEKNAHKDFEISFKINSYTYENNQNTIFSSIDEKGTPFPGFVFRMSKDVANKYELEANSSASKETLNYYNLDDVHDVIIKRVNDILYINIDNGGDTQILDYSTFEKVFYYPLTLGAGLDKDFKPWRYFKGTLSDISVTLEQ